MRNLLDFNYAKYKILQNPQKKHHNQVILIFLQHLYYFYNMPSAKESFHPIIKDFLNKLLNLYTILHQVIYQLSKQFQ